MAEPNEMFSVIEKEFLSVKRRLAHLNALRAFEATARLGSYVSAAAELNVTPAAVGQQIRMLESYLAVPLFDREGRKLVLTESAQAALPDIKESFDRLAQAMDHLKDGGHGPRVTVTLPPSFAAKWLIPRLERFRMAHPGIDLRLDTTDRLVHLPRENIDLGIRYGAGRYEGLESSLLATETVFPVCSPALASGARKLRTPDDLSHFTLIHDTTMAIHPSFPTWSSWLKVARVRGLRARSGLKINSSIMSLQAAVEGQGVALARSIIATDDLREGRLARPFRQALETGFSYHLVRAAGFPVSRAAAAFCRWLQAEMEVFSASA
jgi:LysR family glycine cleavage system transcriptional activator